MVKDTQHWRQSKCFWPVGLLFILVLVSAIQISYTFATCSPIPTKVEYATTMLSWLTSLMPRSNTGETIMGFTSSAIKHLCVRTIRGTTQNYWDCLMNSY